MSSPVDRPHFNFFSCTTCILFASEVMNSYLTLLTSQSCKPRRKAELPKREDELLKASKPNLVSLRKMPDMSVKVLA